MLTDAISQVWKPATATAKENERDREEGCTTVVSTLADEQRERALPSVTMFQGPSSKSSCWLGKARVESLTPEEGLEGGEDLHVQALVLTPPPPNLSGRSPIPLTTSSPRQKVLAGKF